MQNMLILTIRLTPVTLTLFRQSRSYYPDAPISYANIFCKFRENRTMGKGQKRSDGQTAGPPAGWTDKTIPIFAKWQIKNDKGVQPMVWHLIPYSKVANKRG